MRKSAATLANNVSAFQATGLFPFDGNAIPCCTCTIRYLADRDQETEPVVCLSSSSNLINFEPVQISPKKLKITLSYQITLTPRKVQKQLRQTADNFEVDSN
jgi:hypothetical protein